MMRQKFKQLDHTCIPNRDFITIRDFILSRDHRERSSNLAHT